MALYPQQQGYRIVPANPLATEILGERCWPSLTEAARHVQIDLVDVFRQSDEVPAIADEAIAIGARGLVAATGVHHDAGLRARPRRWLAVVQDKCPGRTPTAERPGLTCTGTIWRARTIGMSYAPTTQTPSCGALLAPGHRLHLPLWLAAPGGLLPARIQGCLARARRQLHGLTPSHYAPK